MGAHVREYHKKMDKRMFDFEAFYHGVSLWLPDNSVIAEVGLGDGASSVFLAEALINAGKNFKLHMIDNLAYGGQDQLATILRHVVGAKIGRKIEIHPYSSLEASCRFPDAHFNFVFIDASHRFEYTKADIRLWWQKIKPDGILAGHDYNDSPEGIEVRDAVNLVVPQGLLELHLTTRLLGVWSVRRDLALSTVMN